MLPSLESPGEVVDSMSPPHAAEYTSSQHALTFDCATLQRIDEDIEECRMRIARAHAEMRLLEHQRDVVQHRVFLHRARISSLRAVPDQILQEIFQYCLPDTPYVVPDTRSAPMVLTHVCRRWRVVAQGTSELWSSIAIRDQGVWNCQLEVEMVKQWLDQSRTRPIRMSITCPPRTDFGSDASALCSDIFNLAIAHSAQLKDLYLNVNRTYLHHFVDRTCLPALRSIVISLHSVLRIDEPMELDGPAFLDAPNLERIGFKGSEKSIHHIPPAMFPQITHLTFDCNMILDLSLLFQDFSNLQHLSLTLSLSRNALRFQLPSQHDRRIVGSSLISLQVRLDKDVLDFADPQTLETLLDRLELPALQTLSISASLRPRFDAQTRRTEARWENHPQWVHNPSIASLLSRSRRTPRPRLECRNGTQVVVLPVAGPGESLVGLSFTPSEL